MEQQGTKFIFIVVLFAVIIFYFGGPSPNQIKNSPEYLQTFLQLKQQLPEEKQQEVIQKFGITKLRLIQKQWKDFINKQQNYGVNEEFLDDFYKAAKQLYLKQELRRKEEMQVDRSENFLQSIKNVTSNEIVNQTEDVNESNLNLTDSVDIQITEVQSHESSQGQLEQEVIEIVQLDQSMPLQINYDQSTLLKLEYQNSLISQENQEQNDTLQPEQQNETEQEVNQQKEADLEETEQNQTDLQSSQSQDKEIAIEQYAFKFLQSNPRFKLIDIEKDQEIQIDATRIFLFALFSYFLFIIVKKLMKWKKKMSANGNAKWKNLKNKLIANI